MFGSVALIVVLLAITFEAVTSNDSDGTSAAAGATSDSASRTPAAPRTTSSSQPRSRTHSSSARPAGSPRSSASSSAPLEPCAPGNLDVSAAVGKPSYAMKQKPVLALLVTNVGPVPCAQDLADQQIVLKVYNGESRVWGSHDCAVQSGTDKRTLAVKQPVRVTITWSGFTSQTNGCPTGSRQHVGAGTYTLYASLSGKTGKAAQFTIS